MENGKQSSNEHIPRFERSFLLPRYWGSWLAVGACAAMAWVPPVLRDPLLGQLGRWVGKLATSARRRARINLLYCFPELSEAVRESIIDTMFATAPQSIVMMAELAMRPAQAVKRIDWHNRDIIERLREAQENVIFLVPHGWAVDIPAMLLASEKQKVAGMFQNQSNAVIDYIWNSVRLRFGGRLHSRHSGIKPFVASVRRGYWGYYLPDEDYGAEQSEFVDFFATYKATLPALGRLTKVCCARVVPMFPVYDPKTHRLTIILHEPIEGLEHMDDKTQARRMNQEVESFIRPHPEQYTWILKLLKTRKEGETEPYKRRDL